MDWRVSWVVVRLSTCLSVPVCVRVYVHRCVRVSTHVRILSVCIRLLDRAPLYLRPAVSDSTEITKRCEAILADVKTNVV